MRRDNLLCRREAVISFIHSEHHRRSRKQLGVVQRKDHTQRELLRSINARLTQRIIHATLIHGALPHQRFRL